MRPEAKFVRIHSESTPSFSSVASKAYPDFSGSNWARLERDKIAPVGQISVVLLENTPTKKIATNIEFTKLIPAEVAPSIEDVKKAEAYNPRKRQEKYTKDGRRLIRIKRPSRCNGSHDVEADPCGSPRCRSSKGRDNGVTQKRRRTRRNVVLNPRKVRS